MLSLPDDTRSLSREHRTQGELSNRPMVLPGATHEVCRNGDVIAEDVSACAILDACLDASITLSRRVCGYSDSPHTNCYGELFITDRRMRRLSTKGRTQQLLNLDTSTKRFAPRMTNCSRDYVLPPQVTLQYMRMNVL